MIIYNFVSAVDQVNFCSNCNELCSRQCPVYRKAEIARNEALQKDISDGKLNVAESEVAFC